METTCATIKILLAVEHELFRHGLRNLLEQEPGFQIAAEAADGREAARLTAETNPDILLIDLFLPERSATGVLRHLSSINSNARTFFAGMQLR